MRREGCGEIDLVAEDLGGTVIVLFAAIDATDSEWGVNGRVGSKGVGFAEQDAVSGEEILMAVKLVILADDDPAILAIAHGVWFSRDDGTAANAEGSSEEGCRHRGEPGTGWRQSDKQLGFPASKKATFFLQFPEDSRPRISDNPSRIWH